MFNKKLVISIALASVLFVSGLLAFVIVPNVLHRFHAASAGPTSVTSVSGNGGAAVMAGGYLYFANGFMSKGEETYKEYKQNNYNAVKDQGAGGIWRVKMTGGAPTYDNSYVKDLVSEDIYNKILAAGPNARFNSDLSQYADGLDRMANDLELIVPKIAGWEKTAIWIMGDTLVYTSPNNQKDVHGALQREKIDFFRADLNGEHHRKIYTTKTDDVKPADFAVTWAANAPWLCIKDGVQLVRVNVNTSKPNVVTEKCVTAVFPVVTSYYGGFGDERGNRNASFSGVMGYVYYTSAPDTDDDTQKWMRGNILSRFSIADGTIELLHAGHETKNLKALGDGNLMIEVRYEAPRVPDLFIIGDENFNFKNMPWSAANRAAKPLETEETVYVSGEVTNDFKYITLLKSSEGESGRLLCYTKTAGVWASHPVEIALNVQAILAVTAGGVIFKSPSNQIVTVSYSGAVLNNVDMDAAALGGEARVTAFRYLDDAGQPTGTGTGYMAFYIKTFNEIYEPSHVAKETDTPAKINVGALLTLDADGRNYSLAQLEEKFLVKQFTI